MRGIDAAIAGKLAEPLVTLHDSLDGTTLPAQVAALPDRAAQQIRELGVRLVQAMPTKVVYPDPNVVSPSNDEKLPLRPVQRVHARDVTSVPIVRNAGEWDALKDKLDHRVRSLLDQGYDVELS